MKYLLNFSLCITLAGCSSLVDMDSMEISNIERIELDQKNYERPQFYVEDFEFSKTSRSIASAAPIDNQEITDDLSNRQVYFLTVYKQYKTMAKIRSTKDHIRSCPSFHNVILENRKSLDEYQEIYTLKQDLSILKQNKEKIAKFPVVAMPYSKRQDLFSALVSNEFEDSSSQLEVAFDNYFVSQKKEIEELCDKGVSPGYYTFENLVSYFRNAPDFHRTTKGLKALLKVPVISNMIILDNLMEKDKNYFSSGVSRFENDLLERSNISWFKQYREKLNSDRRKYIGSRSVAGEKL